MVVCTPSRLQSHDLRQLQPLLSILRSIMWSITVLANSLATRSIITDTLSIPPPSPFANPRFFSHTLCTYFYFSLLVKWGMISLFVWLSLKTIECVARGWRISSPCCCSILFLCCHGALIRQVLNVKCLSYVWLIKLRFLVDECNVKKKKKILHFWSYHGWNPCGHYLNSNNNKKWQG